MQQARGDSDGIPATRLSRGLGWLSHGLGLFQIVAPKQLSHLIGVPDDRDNQLLMRALGAREIGNGAGILIQPTRAGWVWARVGGDMMDLALLGAAMRSRRANRGRVAGATAVVAGITALDLLCGFRLRSRNSPRAKQTTNGAIHVERAITINRPPEEVYGVWRQLENLPRFMNHLESVKETSERQSHWTAKGPAGRTVQWDAEITEDRPSEIIAWRSLPGAMVANGGSVRFSPTRDGSATEVRVTLDYTPPAGQLGATVARLFGEEPAQQLREDLLRFKQVMEIGEVVHSDASVYGDRQPHPARPPDGAVPTAATQHVERTQG